MMSKDELNAIVEGEEAGRQRTLAEVELAMLRDFESAAKENNMERTAVASVALAVLRRLFPDLTGGK